MRVRRLMDFIPSKEPDRLKIDATISHLYMWNLKKDICSHLVHIFLLVGSLEKRTM